MAQSQYMLENRDKIRREFVNRSNTGSAQLVGSDIDFMSNNKYNMSADPQDLVRGSSSHTQ